MAKTAEQYQNEIDSLREAYSKGMGMDMDKVQGSIPIEAADSRGEIERLMVELQQAIDELEHTSLKMIEKTADAAAMDRSIPSEGDDAVARQPETRIGNYLFDSILRVRHIQNRLNEHLYKLEL